MDNPGQVKVERDTSALPHHLQCKQARNAAAGPEAPAGEKKRCCALMVAAEWMHGRAPGEEKTWQLPG